MTSSKCENAGEHSDLFLEDRSKEASSSQTPWRKLRTPVPSSLCAGQVPFHSLERIAGNSAPGRGVHALLSALSQEPGPLTQVGRMHLPWLGLRPVNSFSEGGT